MVKRSSAYYQNRYRERLKESGFVKREVWIPPQFADALKATEKALRNGIVPIIPETARSRNMTQQNPWTTRTLLDALTASDPVSKGEIEVELVEGTEPGLHLTMKDFGDLPLFLSVSGSQIIVQTLLWPVEQILDQAAFNKNLLKTHKLFPLSTFGIVQGPDGREYYEMFGALSSGSILESIIFEVETLADNTIQAVQAYQEDLTAAE